jgi:dUTPase
MKFPRPRSLQENEFPDNTSTQPTLFRHLVQNVIHPPENSAMDSYISVSIDYLKNQQRQKTQKVAINSTNIESTLFFVDITIPPSTEKIKCLVDTGASHTILHYSFAKRYNLKFEPLQINLKTATGVSESAVKGILHTNLTFYPEKTPPASFCAQIILSTQLNDLDMILGADFLFNPEKVKNISGTHITAWHNHQQIMIPIEPDQPAIRSQLYTTNIAKATAECEKPRHTTPITKTAMISDLSSCLRIIHDSLLPTVDVNSHSIRADLENETLPPAEELFDEYQELDFALLDKTYSINDGDFSQCPPEYLKPLKNLLNKYDDRFSKTKLDLETTTIYEASLPTEPNLIVDEKCRKLPDHKYRFAMKAINKLQASGVIRPSDSPWRSNVVLVPKPTGKEDLRENTKAEMLSGKHNTSELYRLCLDFRNLNKVLIFPQKTQFTTLDQFLHTLKGKVCVSLDISSAFFIIPIKEEDRYKTAFWVNHNCYEFMNCVMGLKSSPYHLNKFLEKAFSDEVLQKIIATLTPEEQKLLPKSFLEFIISYFDDFFVYANNYDELLVCFKVVLEAARMASIKFSIEKTTFFTTKIKVLGYSFDTKNTNLSMDKLKASAIANMKKPSSLYELHSRLASLQYQSSFLPYLKNILYPLHFLLRKREFTWGNIEEEAWTIAKNLASLNLRLTIPEPDENLVLTTDASKVAAAACLFREKNGKLDLVSVSSKYFATTDLKKSSYMLEAISLAFAFKTFAPYILNCTAKIKVFTDAKSLIFLKRNATHSILLNSTLQYLINFISLVNVEIYHLPGNVNVLADVLSRAIADNLNCSLSKEHAISRQWAKVLPPMPEHFTISHDILYEFLTSPLKTEPHDIYDRSHKRLMEPKNITQMMQLYQKETPEERYHNAISLLEQWNSEYARKHKSDPPSHVARINTTKLTIDLEKQRICLQKLDSIMDTVYADIKGTSLYKQLQKHLAEASKRYLYCVQKPPNDYNIQRINDNITTIFSIIGDIESQKLIKDVKDTFKEDFKEQVQTTQFYNTTPHDNNPPLVYFDIKPTAKFIPQICEKSNGLDIPLQEPLTLQPGELIKTDLQVRFQFPKHYCALLMNKSSARVKYQVQIQLGLIDVGYSDFLQTVIQNMSNETIYIPAGIALVQLLLIKSKIPTFTKEWPETTVSRGSFGSTGHNFKTVDTATNSAASIHENINTNYMETTFLNSPENKISPTPIHFHIAGKQNVTHPIAILENELDPPFLTIDSFHINIAGTPIQRAQQLYDLNSFQAKLLQESTPSGQTPWPVIQKTDLEDINPLEQKHQPGHTAQMFQVSLSDPNLPPSPPPHPPEITHAPISPSPGEIAILLAADLQQNKKLNADSLIYYQTHDPAISRIKDELLGSTNSLKSYILKRNIVCKLFNKDSMNPNKYAIYIPSVLLAPTIIYIHKHFLHTSKTQTFKEFSALYYHPRARQTVSKICNSCITCLATRNHSTKNTTIGRERTLKPTKPRQVYSMDILYLPTSTHGYTHALMIADMYSMYVSFFPLKSKNSTAIATALRSFISFQGVPITLYSDNDPSFQGDVDMLLKTYNIQHFTSFPYTQKNNSVEAQVRLLKNAFRALIQENPICNHRDWDTLYPLVIIRLNSMISKYGLSRELVHFQNTLETHLPTIIDTSSTDVLSDQLDELSKNFYKKVSKFLHNKKTAKSTYKNDNKTTFLLHELVMRKDYNPATPLHPTYIGPYRIMELFPQGALIKDPRNGETLSVHFQNLRRIELTEFLTLLPSNFDSDILATLEMYRYNRPGPIEEPPKSTNIIENDDYIDSTKLPELTKIAHDCDKFPQNPTTPFKILRSGKKIYINHLRLPHELAVNSVKWKDKHDLSLPLQSRITKTILKKPLYPAPTPYATITQVYLNDIWVHDTTLNCDKIRSPRKNYKTRYKSNYQSAMPGTLYVKIENDFTIPKRTVQFTGVTVHFY